MSSRQIEAPDEPLECSRCDGQKVVLVVDDELVWSWTHYGTLWESCPQCNGTGEEPEPDPWDDPRIP